MSVSVCMCVCVCSLCPRLRQHQLPRQRLRLRRRQRPLLRQRQRLLPSVHTHNHEAPAPLDGPRRSTAATEGRRCPWSGYVSAQRGLTRRNGRPPRLTEVHSHPLRVAVHPAGSWSWRRGRDKSKKRARKTDECVCLVS